MYTTERKVEYALGQQLGRSLLVLEFRGVDEYHFFCIKLFLPKRNNNEAGIGYGKSWPPN